LVIKADKVKILVRTEDGKTAMVPLVAVLAGMERKILDLERRVSELEERVSH